MISNKRRKKFRDKINKKIKNKFNITIEEFTEENKKSDGSLLVATSRPSKKTVKIGMPKENNEFYL